MLLMLWCCCRSQTQNRAVGDTLDGSASVQLMEENPCRHDDDETPAIQSQSSKQACSFCQWTMTAQNWTTFIGVGGAHIT
jgi:hypothetical protein